jgi:phosphoglucosamine mutase
MPKGERYRLFGTDGIRGAAEKFPLDAATVELIGRAVTENLANEVGRQPAIIIGRDTRQSGPAIESALTRGARCAGGHVESAGVITTPGVAFLARANRFDAGIVISASHNPYQDNGIKVFSTSGKKLADEVEQRIEQRLWELIEARADKPDAPRRQPVEQGRAAEARYHEQYIDYLVTDVAAGLRLDGYLIAVDCANGAACEIAPAVFKKLAARIEVMCASPDGRNINEGCGSLHTDVLRRLVLERKADLGVAFDGDADRALFIDSRGSLIDGDHVILLLASYMKSRGRLAGNLVVTTVMSNIGLEIALRERGIETLRAAVGDRFVLEELLAREARLGGEQSGHIIFPDISLAGDGIITAIEVLRAVKESGRTLGDLASELKKFPQVLVNVRVASKPPLESLHEVAAEIRRVEDEMQGRGRLLIRYSGTEQIARVMIEGEDQATIERQAARIAEVIKKSIG